MIKALCKSPGTTRAGRLSSSSYYISSHTGTDTGAEVHGFTEKPRLRISNLKTIETAVMFYVKWKIVGKMKLQLRSSESLLANNIYWC